MKKIFLIFFLGACVSEQSRTISSYNSLPKTDVLYSRELLEDFPEEGQWQDTETIQYSKTTLFEFLKNSLTNQKTFNEDNVTIILIDRGFFLNIKKFLDIVNNKIKEYKSNTSNIHHLPNYKDIFEDMIDFPNKAKHIVLLYYKETHKDYQDFLKGLHEISLRLRIFLNSIGYKNEIWSAYSQNYEFYLENKFFPENYQQLKSFSQFKLINNDNLNDTIDKIIKNIKEKYSSERRDHVKVKLL